MPDLTAFDAKLALEQALQAADDLNGVHVQLGLPAEIPASRERIYIVGTDDWTADEAAQQPIEAEAYDIPLLIEVHELTDRSATEQRFWAVVRAVRAAVRADEELGGTVWRARLARGSESTNPTTDGWISRGTFFVRCEAFIDG